MPAQGIVTVEITPWQASGVLWWLEFTLRQQEVRHPGVLGDFLWGLRDRHDIESLAAQFRKLTKRKRVGGPFKKVVVQLSRKDAAWLAQKVKPGMFGGAARKALPSEVKALGYQCSGAVAQRRGRKVLARDRLQAALEREHLDERHRKRLRRRHREEVKLRESAGSLQGILAKALMDATKST